MASLNDPLLVFWRSLGDWGLIIVIVAVALEVGVAAIGLILEKWWKDKFEKWEPCLKRYEVMAGWILVIGLAMEYWGHKRKRLFWIPIMLHYMLMLNRPKKKLAMRSN